MKARDISSMSPCSAGIEILVLSENCEDDKNTMYGWRCILHDDFGHII